MAISVATVAGSCVVVGRSQLSSVAVFVDLNEFVLFARKQDISRISLDTDDMTDVVVPVTGLDSVVALDWDSQTDYVYWTDVAADSISRARWDGTGQQVLSTTYQLSVWLCVSVCLSVCLLRARVLFKKVKV